MTIPMHPDWEKHGGGFITTTTTNPPPSRLPREQMLDEAKSIVAGDRDKQYAGPEESFSNTAKLWSVQFDREFTAADVAIALALLKVSRLKTGGVKQHDTWVDLAGYAACGYEVSGSSKNRP